MSFNRRTVLAMSATAGASVAATAAPSGGASTAPLLASLGLDATHFGVRPGSPDDQTRVLQRAIDQAARSRAPLALPPGNYRVGDLTLPSGAQLVGVRGATRLVLSQGRALVTSRNADGITLSGLVLDGGSRPLPERQGLLVLANGRGIRVVDCEVLASSRNGIMLDAIEGEVSGTTVTGAVETAIYSLDARGLLVARNTIRDAGDNGIQVWRREKGDDGTRVFENLIENVANRSGGSGQYGNGINAFRAANVNIGSNRIRNCAFSAIRGNAASNIQIIGNSCTALGEVALYAEFGFEGAVIANNTVDTAGIGVSVTNFNEGGRLGVVQGNLIRNLTARSPAGRDVNDVTGIGIGVEADTAVSGNVVENAPMAGIAIGFGRYQRDVTVTGNVVRSAGMGVAVSVAAGAGTALIANNLIADTRRGAIVGLNRYEAVTGDLHKDGAARYPQLTISSNRVP